MGQHLMEEDHQSSRTISKALTRAARILGPPKQEFCPDAQSWELSFLGPPCHVCSEIRAEVPRRHCFLDLNAPSIQRLDQSKRKLQGVFQTGFQTCDEHKRAIQSK